MNDVMNVGRRMDENRQVHRAGSFSPEKRRCAPVLMAERLVNGKLIAFPLTGFGPFLASPSSRAIKEVTKALRNAVYTPTPFAVTNGSAGGGARGVATAAPSSGRATSRRLA